MPTNTEKQGKAGGGGRKKGMSIEEKCSAMEQYFRTHPVPFTLKELEGCAPRATGVIHQSIAECLEILCSEGRCSTAKIGVSTFFWRFDATAGLQQQAKRAQLEQQVLDLKRSILALEQEREENISRYGAIEERQRLGAQVQQLKQSNEEMRRQLTEGDLPGQLAEAKQQVQQCVNHTNIWTENIYLLQDYCTKRFGLSKQQFRQSFGIPDDFDFLEPNDALLAEVGAPTGLRQPPTGSTGSVAVSSSSSFRQPTHTATAVTVMTDSAAAGMAVERGRERAVYGRSLHYPAIQQSSSSSVAPSLPIPSHRNITGGGEGMNTAVSVPSRPAAKTQTPPQLMGSGGEGSGPTLQRDRASSEVDECCPSSPRGTESLTASTSRAPSQTQAAGSAATPTLSDIPPVQSQLTVGAATAAAAAVAKTTKPSEPKKRQPRRLVASHCDISQPPPVSLSVPEAAPEPTAPKEACQVSAQNDTDAQQPASGARGTGKKAAAAGRVRTAGRKAKRGTTDTAEENAEGDTTDTGAATLTKRKRPRRSKEAMQAERQQQPQQPAEEKPA